MRVILVGILMVTLVLVPTLAMSASGSRDMDNSGSTMPNNSGTYSAPKDSGSGDMGSSGSTGMGTDMNTNQGGDSGSTSGSTGTMDRGMHNGTQPAGADTQRYNTPKIE